MNSKKPPFKLVYLNNAVVWQEYLALLQERDLVWGLVDDGLAPQKHLDEVEHLVSRYQEEISIRKERGDWAEPSWALIERPLTEFEKNMMIGSDRAGSDPREMFKSCLQFLNTDLTQKIKYVPPQRPVEDWEAPVWGTIKRQAIIELNDGSITKENAKLLYLFRISDSWEKFHEALWVNINQREFFNNMQTKKKKTSPKR